MPEDRLLRLGVIGLGKRWQKRYQPALQRLKDRFQIAAVADQVQQLAARESKQLNCAAARGVVEMVRHPDVDAVLLADAQWFGLWPLTVAAQQGKPVFCGMNSGSREKAEFQSLNHSLDRAAVLADLPLRFSPLLGALREICSSHLGQPRWLVCTLSQPEQGQTSTREFEELFPSDYLDFCLQVMGGEPKRFLATGLPEGELTNLLVEFEDGRAMQLTRCRVKGKRSCRLELFAEHGSAVAELPGRLRWSNANERWSRTVRRGRSSCRQLLRHFYRAVVLNEELSPNLQDALNVWRWQRLASESWQRGLWTEVSG